MLLWKSFKIFPRNRSCQSSYFRWKLIGLFFSAVSGVKIKNLQRSEQAHFLVSRLHRSISCTRLRRARLCSNVSILAGYYKFWTWALDMVTWYWSADTSFRQVQFCMPRLTYWLEYGHPLARLLLRRHRAYGPTSNTANQDHHEKINSWVPMSVVLRLAALRVACAPL